MPPIRTSAPMDAITVEDTRSLQISDLDAGFRLKLGPMIETCVELSYAGFVDSVDVAALREAGIVSVATSAEFSLHAGALAVGGPLRCVSRATLCELSGRGTGAVGARMGFVCDFEFSSPPGTGDPRRYRERTGEAEPAGSGRIILTMVRPHERPAQRLVAEPPEPVRHLNPHPLTAPAPDAESLGAVPADFAGAEPATAQTPGVFGLHQTDINQYVYTGAYAMLVAEHATALLAQGGGDAARHAAERVALIFRSPFSAGDRYVARARQHQADGRTLTVVGLHPVREDAVEDRPAVLGRMLGGQAGARTAPTASTRDGRS